MLAIAMMLGMLGAVAMVGGAGEVDEDDLTPDPDPTPDPETDPEGDLLDDPDPGPRPRPIPDPDPTPDPDPIPDPGPVPDPDPIPVPDPIPDPDPVPDPDPIPDPVPIPDPDPVPDPGPIPDPDPVPDPGPIPDPDPVPDPGPIPDPGPGSGVSNVIFGVNDSGWETILGTDGADVIYGGAAQDQVIAYGGDDLVYLEGSYNGYAPEPRLSNADLFDQFGGDDTVYGGDEFDDLRDPIGANVIYGGGGDDYVVGEDISPRTGAVETGPVADRLYGGDGNDNFFGIDNGDTVTGGAGFDRYAIRDEAVYLPGTTTYDFLDDPVVITDLAPFESISIQVNWQGQVNAFSTEDLVQTVVGNDLVVSLQGKSIAILQGVTAPIGPNYLYIEYIY